MQLGFGAGFLWGIRNDTNAPALVTPRRLGALQDVNLSFDGEIKDLFAQFQYPIDVARGKTKIAGKAKMAEINAHQFNDLFFGRTLATGNQQAVVNEVHTASSGTFTVNNTSGFIDLGLRRQSDGKQFELMTSAPSAGSYEVSAGTYTLNAADTLAMLVDYLWTSTLGFSVALDNPLMGTTPSFKGIFTDTFEGATVTLILNKCVSTKLSMPTKVDDYIIEEFDFSAFADAGGNVGSYNVTGV